MRIMLDAPPRKVAELTERHEYEFWQLRTPLTRHRIGQAPYALDNGCYSDFKRKYWERMVEQAADSRPVFVTLPDIVGDAVRTLDLFDQFCPMTNGLPRALVLQDGIGNHRIPWDELDAVFVGGSDFFKISHEARNAVRVAKMLGKWVHVGRVNTPERLQNWIGIADSIDGSGISRMDFKLDRLIDWAKGDHPQAVMTL